MPHCVSPISERNATCLRAADGVTQAPITLPPSYRFAVPNLPQRQRPFAGYKRFQCFTNTCNLIHAQHVDPQQRTGCVTIVVSSSVFSVQGASQCSMYVETDYFFSFFTGPFVDQWGFTPTSQDYRTDFSTGYWGTRGHRWV